MSVGLARRLGALLLAAGAWACADGTGPDAAPEAVALAFSVQPPAAVSAAETAAIDNAFDQVDTYLVSLEDSATSAVLLFETVAVTPGADEYRFEYDLSQELLGIPVLVTVVGLAGGLELYRGAEYTTVAAVTSAASAPPVTLAVRYTGPGIRGKVVDDGGGALAGVSVGLYQDAVQIATVPTEDDGTYLFLGVAAGSYSVEPAPPNGLFLCPAGRDLSVAANAALVADFVASGTPCQIELLVLSGGDVDNTTTVAQLFANTPGVNTDTFFFVSQLPGLATLRRYDVVLLFTNGIFDETTQLGNQLRDYVDVGGNLVIGTFYWQGRSDSEFITPGWGDLEGVDPFLVDAFGFTQQGGATYQANDLGQVILPDHPLIQGVNNLISLSGFSAGVLPRVEATVVAQWADGAPLAGYRLLESGQRVVGISLFPAAVNPTQVSGDSQVLWENAVTWAGNAGGPIP